MWCHESMNPQNLQCLVISITHHFQSIGHKYALHAGTSGSITYMCPEPLLENVWYIAPVLLQRLAKPARNLHCRALTGTIDNLVKSSDYGKDDIYADGACSDDESDYDDEEEPE